MSVTTIGQAFDEFHEANPKVYARLERLALDMLRTGYSHIGIGHLAEVFRWQMAQETRDPNSAFKLNNNYRSRYARLLIENNPGLAGVIKLRELRAA